MTGCAMGLVGQIVLVVGLILGAGFLAAAEIVLLATRRSRLEELAESGHWAARLALAVREPGRLLRVTRRASSC